MDTLRRIRSRAKASGDDRLASLAADAATLDLDLELQDQGREWFDDQFPPDTQDASWMVCFPTGPLAPAAHGLVHKACLPFPAGSLKALQFGWRVLQSPPDGAVCAHCGEHKAPDGFAAWQAHRPGLIDDPRVAALLDLVPVLGLKSGFSGERLPEREALQSVVMRLYTTWLIAQTHGDSMVLAGWDDARWERHLGIDCWATVLQSMGWGVVMDEGFAVTGPEVTR